MKRPFIATLGAALAFSAMAGPTHANEMKIEYADLNLATAEGQATLEARIDRAAKEVCGIGKVRTGTRIPPLESKRCFAEAKASATRQMAALVNDMKRGG